jgi:hypothetical protein
MRSEPPGWTRCEASPRGGRDAKRTPRGGSEPPGLEASPREATRSEPAGRRHIAEGLGRWGCERSEPSGGPGGRPPREDTASQVAGGPKGLQAWSDAGWLRGQTTRRRIHRRSDGGPERRQVLRRGTRAPLCMLHRNPPLCVKTGLEADLATHLRLGGRSALSLLLFRACFLAKRAGRLRPGRRCLSRRPPSRPSGCVRGDVACRQPWFVGPKTTGASGLTAAVGDHYGEIGDGDSTDCRNRRPPAGARYEQGNRGRKTSDPDTHHDQVAALP